MTVSVQPLSLAFLCDPNSIHTRRWTGYLAGRGHRVTLVVGQTQTVNPGLPAGIEVERFVPYNHRRMHLLGALDARRSLRGILKRLNPDVLHAHYLTVHGWHAWISGFHPYAITVWGSDVIVEARETRRGHLYARLSLGSADLVTGTSDYLLAVSVAEGAKPERTRLIHFGVDSEQFRPGPDPVALRSRLGLEGRRIIFSPRTIAPLYHHETVIEALARLPGDVVVLMTRHLADAVELEALQAGASELGVRDRMILVDSVPHAEMPDYYRMADVVVSVADSDGGPITVVEALAAGRPIVATDLPSVREWQDVLDPAGLVPIADAPATARAIETLLSRSPAEREELARRGRQVVEERAGERANMERMETLYRQLAARRRKGA